MLFPLINDSGSFRNIGPLRHHCINVDCRGVIKEILSLSLSLSVYIAVKTIIQKETETKDH